MRELPSTGNRFTWLGKRSDQWIHCRLDRSFGNTAWFNYFPQSHQWFLERIGSDHRPVLMKKKETGSSRKRLFRFDKRWAEDPDVYQTIQQSWSKSNASPRATLSSRLISCRNAISKWKSVHDTNSQVKIKELRALYEEETSKLSPNSWKLNSIKEELAVAFRKEEAFWRQKSRDKWLQCGDKNTKFFHATVKANRARNYIEALIDDNGVTTISDEGKGAVAIKYFEELFKASEPASQELYDMVFSDFEAKVTPEMNENLTRDISIEEIRLAVLSIKSDSAPGHDGFTSGFFKTYWEIVKNEVIDEVQRFFHDCRLREDWGLTFISLIPKIPKPKRMSDLRPISLCTVTYKIISKVMVHRLQPILQHLISPTQSAFVASRLISDNISIAHEIIHGLHTLPSLSSEFMLVKTDMSKAYDRVEWHFLEEILVRLGFCSKWIQWVMLCVKNVKFSVLINGQVHGLIHPSRGLRQGDPLSPFLFVLGTEALIHIIKKAERNCLITGIRFHMSGPSITNLLFADDSLFVCKASKGEAQALMNCFRLYELVSGQKINLDKSAITFGDHVHIGIRDWIQNFTGIVNQGGSSKYLGLPECLSGSKKKLLNFIKEKLAQRLTGWYAKSLSTGGKEILLKSVALALPVYAMTCFKFPITLCKTLTSVILDFWWNSDGSRRKIHWVNLEKLSLPKRLGGIGFKDLSIFNQAILAKQSWRLLVEPNSLFAQVFRSRYYPTGSILNAVIGKRPSYIWRSVIHGRELLFHGLGKTIGNGADTRLWLDNWIWDSSLRCPSTPLFPVDIEDKVQSIIDVNQRSWDYNKMRLLFNQKDFEVICRRKPMIDRPDRYHWHYTKSGNFSVKSAYDLGRRLTHASLFHEAELQPSLNSLYELCWRIKGPSKIKHFLWRILRGSLAVVKRLKERGMKLHDSCLMCDEEESINHLFFQCPFARLVWAVANVPVPSIGYSSSIYENMFHLFQLLRNAKASDTSLLTIPWILWQLWKNRNKALFEGLTVSAQELVMIAISGQNQWFAAQGTVKDAQVSDLVHRDKSRWQAPKVGELKCNISFAWSQTQAKSGAAWVLRNHIGEVIAHSRRAYSQVHTLMEAKFRSWEWALESMTSLHHSEVVFACSSMDTIQALHKPNECSAWLGFLAPLLQFTANKPKWCIQMEEKSCNMGAFKIAQSVIKEGRFASYIAAKAPRWLQEFFDKEQQQLLVS